MSHESYDIEKELGKKTELRNLKKILRFLKILSLQIFLKFLCVQIFKNFVCGNFFKILCVQI